MVMNPQILPYGGNVPANSTRYFETALEASKPPEGFVELVQDLEQGFVYNQAFDDNLIKWDHSYCSTLGTPAPLANYLWQTIFPLLPPKAIIVDIGCGQGEFVDQVEKAGFEAYGYDPVLRQPASNLFQKRWTSSDSVPADLFVMKCVLPHIANPWDFLDEIFQCFPESFVLVEYQSLAHVLAEGLWQQISHDHVNLFDSSSFAVRYSLLEYGRFFEGEWEFALLARKGSKLGSKTTPKTFDRESLTLDFLSLTETKRTTISKLQSSGRPIAVWGAAGKGTVLTHAIQQHTELAATIDADANRWGKYPEKSRSSVLPPSEAKLTLPPETLILASNPRHRKEIQKFLNDQFDVIGVDKHLTLG
tara:strand:+ start:518 stop:1603 length:1086 start_codon:yes stop_codon:yes gene_type:complete